MYVDEECTGLLQRMAGTEVTLEAIAHRMFLKSRAFFNLSAFKPFSYHEEFAIAKGLVDYLTKEECPAVTLSPVLRPPLSSHNPEPEELALLFSDDFVWESEYLEPRHDRLNAAVWLLAILIRVRTCRDIEACFPSSVLVRFLLRASELLNHSEFVKLCSSLSEVLDKLGTYPIV